MSMTGLTMGMTALIPRSYSLAEPGCRYMPACHRPSWWPVVPGRPPGPFFISSGVEGSDLQSTASQTLSLDGLYSVGWLFRSSSRQTGRSSGFLCLIASWRMASRSSSVGASARTPVSQRAVTRGDNMVLVDTAWDCPYNGHARQVPTGTGPLAAPSRLPRPRSS